MTQETRRSLPLPSVLPSAARAAGVLACWLVSVVVLNMIACA